MVCAAVAFHGCCVGKVSRNLTSVVREACRESVKGLWLDGDSGFAQVKNGEWGRSVVCSGQAFFHDADPSRSDAEMRRGAGLILTRRQVGVAAVGTKKVDGVCAWSSFFC